jgi:OmpA-like transmembrane domain
MERSDELCILEGPDCRTLARSLKGGVSMPKLSMSEHSAVRVLPFVFLGLLAAKARAEDLLGLYAGGTIGRSQIIASAFYPSSLDPYPGEFKKEALAFQAVIGFRPISWIGAELSYFDLGHSEGSIFVTAQTMVPHAIGYKANASIKGTGAFGIIYLPVRLIDLYAKVGIARTQSSLSGLYPSGNDLCMPNLPCGTNPFQLNDTSIGLAEGAGIQYKLGACAIRAEYERFNSLSEHPNLLSLGVTWTFL